MKTCKIKLKKYEEKSIKLKNVDKIRYIYHCSDIHIYSHQRHEEYLEVFENMNEILRKRVINKDSIMVIAGDIVHTFRTPSYKMIDIARKFIKKISEIIPVVLIAGNHDMSNKDEALTSLFDDIDKMYNVIYLKDSGVYKLNNIKIGLTSVMDYKLINAKNIRSELNVKKIGLFHGMVNGSIACNGQMMDGENIGNKKIGISDFNGYDYVLLGDIHKHQYLKKNVAYSGSLIQQNHGEEKDNHGMICWDIINDKSEYIKVPNRYSFMTIRIKDGIMLEKMEEISEIVRLRIYTENTKYEKTMEIIKEISKTRTIENYKIEEKSINDIKTQIYIGNETNNIQKELFEKYLNEMNDKKKNKIIEIDSEMNKNIGIEEKYLSGIK